MTRIRTHNKRAKRVSYTVFAARRNRARKALRYAQDLIDKIGKLLAVAASTKNEAERDAFTKPQYLLPKRCS